MDLEPKKKRMDIETYLEKILKTYRPEHDIIIVFAHETLLEELEERWIVFNANVLGIVLGIAMIGGFYFSNLFDIVDLSNITN